jgi:hypothetical protein|tara:strand:- start:932 stop:1321 length:390 start_codon:yes stop_codon:yes gene_type:complete
MAKKPSRSKVVKQLDSVFSQYIRQREAVNEIATCFTCGKRDHWKRLQNGHFQSRKHYSTRWDETNCQVQCAGCNVFKYGEQFIFGQNLDIKYGLGTSNDLYIKAKKTVKISTVELQDMIKHYKSFVVTT